MTPETTFLIYNPHTPALIELTDTVTVLVSVKNDVAIAEVPTSLVPLAMSKKYGCCDSYKQSFRYATEEEITLWRK